MKANPGRLLTRSGFTDSRSPSRGKDSSNKNSTMPWPRIAPICLCGPCCCLSYSFGFRKAELIGNKKAKQPPLKVSDVNLFDGILQLKDSKNGEPRKISLTQDAKNLLTECVKGKSAEDAVFTRGSGNSVKDFRVTWNKVTLAAGCPGLLFHDLLRSAVRNMVRAGVWP
jgi:hypothetical protein